MTPMTPTSRRIRRAASLCAGALLLTAPVAEARTTISSGHVDAVSARLSGGRLHSVVKDGTRAGRVVWRDPASVVIRVVPKAAVRLPAGLGFVGPRGARVWMIPQVQRAGVVWAGWNTEAIGRGQLRGGVRWTLRRVSGPGKVVIFQTGSFGSSSVLFNSGSRLPQATTIPVGTHAHGNWAFTRRGTYRLTYRLSARAANGRPLHDDATLTFRVG
ncbi:choice-of-anchor M domain-containing protein [Conexibacter arvalis]|uniref:Putative ABC transporter-associated repeat protein n=1 Tax=Conexibacter arvalis TaxID=912552 RepID=A0A840IFL5_9ACTN|nr:choice-of-anchor M domain-containing protein [Conexibacter arvalis]MBB4662854.1 putative ABC transporter-associated repeat protein [Conexibacter arvalis]